MRICVIASSRHPIIEPFAGGLEAWTHALVTELDARGHEVTLFAAPGSDPSLPVTALAIDAFLPTEAAQRDVHSPSLGWMYEHHAYLGLMLGLARKPDRFDVVHNSSLHHLPVAMAPSLGMPMVTTLHTPPVPWLESAVAVTREPGTFVAVSDVTARAWADTVPAIVIRNGVDTDIFKVGPGGGGAVWTGRMVREKAPHLAIDAARRAGVSLLLAGPVSDPAYFMTEVQPRLGAGCRYLGHLHRREIVELLGTASVSIVTPDWDEPYGLVAAEAMACGTPVAAIARGALPELVAPETGQLAAPGDLDALGRAIRLAQGRNRAAVRLHAERNCSLARMVDTYERLYLGLAEREAA